MRSFVRPLLAVSLLGVLTLSPTPTVAQTTPADNTALGLLALQADTSGAGNTALGSTALAYNTTGQQNTAVGQGALNTSTSGNHNVALGMGALEWAVSGSHNVAVGVNTGAANGNNATTSTNLTLLGYQAGLSTPTQLDNATAIGSNASVGASNALVLGSPGTNVGVGTATPQSRVQIAGGGSGYDGVYLQLPVVQSPYAPPAHDCSATTYAGRVVLQDYHGRITLWVCSAYYGVWEKL